MSAPAGPGAVICRSLETVEWHNAHVMPTRSRCSLPSGDLLTCPFTPTTAFRSSSARVVCGSSSGMLPSVMPWTTWAGSAAASIFRPTDAAVSGSTADSITVFSFNVSVQNVSSPNVSKRKVCLPAATSCASSGTCGTWLVGAGLALSSEPPQPARLMPSATDSVNGKQALRMNVFIGFPPRCRTWSPQVTIRQCQKLPGSILRHSAYGCDRAIGRRNGLSLQHATHTGRHGYVSPTQAEIERYWD